MRKIEIKEWKKTIDGEEKDENFAMVLKALLLSQKPETIRGIDKFRQIGRLAKAFEKAEETKILELEEADYSFLKGLIEKEITGLWAFQKGNEEFIVLESIELFMDAKLEEK